jgi:prevent-host-death family protein
MDTVSVGAANADFSELLTRVEAGEEIIVARDHKPIARLVPITPSPPKRQYGKWKDKISIGPEFFDPLPEDEMPGLE